MGLLLQQHRSIADQTNKISTCMEEDSQTRQVGTCLAAGAAVEKVQVDTAQADTD